MSLSDNQMSFCLEYINNGLNGKQAYKSSYPSCKSDQAAEVGASRLLRNDKVKKHINELRAELKERKLSTIEDRMRWLDDIRLGVIEETVVTGVDKEGKQERVNVPIPIKERLKANDQLNRMDGAYIEKVELSGQINDPFKDMTTEELLEYKKLLEKNG